MHARLARATGCVAVDDDGARGAGRAFGERMRERRERSLSESRIRGAESKSPPVDALNRGAAE